MFFPSPFISYTYVAGYPTFTGLVQRLNAKEKEVGSGLTFRPPTEAEWEYCCRAGTTTHFHFGKTISSKEVNFDGNSPFPKGEVKSEYRGCTVPVDDPQFKDKANKFGLFHMHGNVWEWCSDLYGGPVQRRVSRGGGWGNPAHICRSAHRSNGDPASHGYKDCGFRLVAFSSQ
jgi:formylglycine-generating enzyme required for sulfatase activity